MSTTTAHESQPEANPQPGTPEHYAQNVRREWDARAMAAAPDFATPDGTETPWGWINNDSGEYAEDFDALAEALGTTPRELDDALTTAARFEADDDGGEYRAHWYAQHDSDSDPDEPESAADILGDWEPARAYDWIDARALDVLYLIGPSGTVRGAEIALTIGGPNVWLNTRDREIAVYWGGGDPVRVSIAAHLVDDLEEAAAEMFEGIAR